MNLSEQVIVAIISGGSVVVAAVLGAFDKLFKRKALSTYVSKSKRIAEPFKRITEINAEVVDLFTKTTADRFLILLYEKGIKCNYVTAIHEQHKYLPNVVNLSYGATSRYYRLETDSEYESIISEIRRNGVKKLSLSTMDDGMLKNFYTYENVNHSNIYFLYEFDNGDLFFISIAKHDAIPFSRNEETLFQLTASRLKQLIIDLESDT